MTIVTSARTTTTAEPVSSVSLELTKKCQNTCVHCLTESSPHQTHGVLTTADWRQVIDEAAACGATQIQFIGGEPTVHPGLPELIRAALAHHLMVEVFSNLYRLTGPVWQALCLPGVQLATSYYSAAAAEHDAVTAVPGSHARTRANIVRAVELNLPLRAGIPRVLAVQDVDGAVRDLRMIGVARELIQVDRLRHVGRGAGAEDPSYGDLCGDCTNRRLAVFPDASVGTCILARWLPPVGDVRESSLREVVEGPLMRERLQVLGQVFGSQAAEPPCIPKGGPCLPHYPSPLGDLPHP